MIGTKHNNNPHTKSNPLNFHYIPDKAQKKYLLRRKESKQKCPLKTIALFEFVIRQLKEGVSPELIAGRAKLKDIGDISHECIYQFIYSKQGKDLKLYEYLVRAHKRRRKQKGRKHRKPHIPNRVGIELRPKGANSRKEFGHWETDSVLGKVKRSALNTNRERKSRYVLMTKIPRKTAENTRVAICNKFKHLPLKARLSNTADNGCEFTEHEKITEEIDMTFFFANPYHSWERGTNENGNGLIRRFFPKKTDFDLVTNEQIQAVENWINNRPMKCLDFKTPHEVFHEELALCQKKKRALDS